MRRIIQITAVPASQTNPAMVFALCDDGVLFGARITGDSTWVKVRPVPQDEPEPVVAERVD